MKVAFGYDRNGRLIEQDTDPHDFDRSGSQNELPPGKISVVYDDEKHTKTPHTGSEGVLASTVTRNARGETVGFAIETTSMNLEAVLHCTEDSHGNWTACQEAVKTGSVSRVEKMWRRTITYR